MNADELLVGAPRARQITEAERLDTIARLGMNHTGTIATFEALIHAMRMLFELSSAYLLIDDADTMKIWGGGTDVVWTLPRRRSFSVEVIETGRPVVILNVDRDPRFTRHPYVTRADPVRFFVGIPLKSTSGVVVATLCGFDTRDRQAPDEALIETLEQLAATAVVEIELEAANADLARQEAVLSRRTQILETTFDTITEGVTAFDRDLGLVTFNRFGAAMLDLPPDLKPGEFDFVEAATDWAGLGFYGEGDPEALAQGRAAVLKASIADGTLSGVEDWNVVLNDGRTIRRRVRPLRDGCLTTYRDLSEECRRQAELAQHARYFELQHGFAALASGAPDLTTAFRRIVEFNTLEIGGSVAHVWIKDGEDLVSTGILYVADRPALTPAEAAALAAGIRRPSPLALASAAAGAMQYAAQDPDLGDLGSLCGQGLARAGYAAPLRILDGVYVIEFYGPGGIGPKSWHGAIVKDLEMQLSRVAERERSERRKTEFISTISHELRTPLTSLRGMLEILESGLLGALPETVGPLIAQAGSDSRVLGTRIEDALAIHDLRHGGVAPSPARCDLAALVGRIARDKGHDAARDGEGALDGWVDEALLARALDKLLAQAADVAPDRPARMEIAALRGEIEIRVAVIVTDATDLDALLESTGVQLATRLVERAGGRLVSEITPRGVVFRTHVPAAFVDGALQPTDFCCRPVPSDRLSEPVSSRASA